MFSLVAKGVIFSFDNFYWWFACSFVKSKLAEQNKQGWEEFKVNRLVSFASLVLLQIPQSCGHLHEINQRLTYNVLTSETFRKTFLSFINSLWLGALWHCDIETYWTHSLVISAHFYSSCCNCIVVKRNMVEQCLACDCPHRKSKFWHLWFSNCIVKFTRPLVLPYIDQQL